MAGDSGRRYAKRIGDRSRLERAIVWGGMNGMDAWQRYAAQEAKSSAETGAPVDTGRLARSIRDDPAYPQETSPLMFAGQIASFGVEYARAHELGSGIHAPDPADRQLILIEAGFWTGKSDKKALNFVWADGPTDHPAYNSEGKYAGTFTFRRVYHPGVPAAHGGRGYLRYSAEESVPVGRRLMLQAITVAMKQLGVNR
jgi:hypothetical protein